MHVNELNLEELQHEHPLTLVDLQMMLDYEEDDEGYDENELIRTQNFDCICNRCDKRIDWYHRYYYKCSMSLCNYSLHKFCEEMPKTLKFQGHPSHTLTLKKIANDDQNCHGCFKLPRYGICYHCSKCDYGIDLLCATFVEQNTIHHPGHPHPLIFVSVEPGLNKCFACGKKHEGHFYQCTTCFNFLINSKCLSLPIKLSLKTKQFSHRHSLTLSYSFPDQLYDCECRICGVKLEDENLIYMCIKCMYYTHVDCATQRTEPFMSILLPGLGKTNKNFKDVDHPRLLHFPLAEESPPLLSQVELEETCQFDPFDEMNKITNASSRVSLHDPMKRIKLLCAACTRPITKFPFYELHVVVSECYFYFHDWCTRLPFELRNHVGHPHHTLSLGLLSVTGKICNICGLPFNGFAYHCREETCGYNIDVNCAFMPEEITHEAHADHLLTRVYAASSSSRMECRACRVSIDNKSEQIYFRCNACDFCLDCRCALHLPKTIRNKCDRHPLQLSYSPIEDHRSEYFCEVCEEGLDPGKWFYHCVRCAQSIHSACAPLILQSEQGANSLHLEGVFKFINILFGVRPKLRLHQHPVALAPGTENDGLCPKCRSSMQSNMILKCLDCSFAMHHTCFFHEEGFTVAPIDRYGGIKRTIKHQPRRIMEFYPSEMMRPVTRHYEVIDDDI